MLSAVILGFATDEANLDPYKLLIHRWPLLFIEEIRFIMLKTNNYVEAYCRLRTAVTATAKIDLRLEKLRYVFLINIETSLLLANNLLWKLWNRKYNKNKKLIIKYQLENL